MPFLPPNHKYLYALNATREIVNGLKYEIIFVMLDGNDDEIYCEMDVLEKPWLIRDSRKFRKMTYNNCSLTNPLDDDDQMRFHYEINPTFINQRTELTNDELGEMEDQIITAEPRETTSTSTLTIDEDDDVTLPPLNPSSKNLLDDFFNMNNFFPPPQTPTTTSTTLSPMPNFNMDALDEMFGIKKLDNSQAESTVRDSSNDNLQQKRVETVDKVPTKNETALKELETEIKKVFSELFQSDPEFQSNIIALINRKDDSTVQHNYNYVVSILASKLKDKIETFNERRNDEIDEVQQVTIDPLNGEGDVTRRKRSHSKHIWNLAENALETLDRIDYDDKKRILVNILSVNKIDGKQKSFRIEATVVDSLCQENSPEIGQCGEKIDQKSLKICLLEVKFESIWERATFYSSVFDVLHLINFVFVKI